MPPSISTLHPPTNTRPSALALRLNPEVLQQLRSLQRAHQKPKLIVKDGKFSIKISDTLVYPCSASPETLRLDVYSPKQSTENDYVFTGTVTSRLNVLSDPKQIREHMRVAADVPDLPPPSERAAPPEKAPTPTASAPKRPSSVDSKAYSVVSSDSGADVTAKFISLVALGPMTKPFIEEKMNLQKYLRQSEIDQLFSAHTQPYLRKDTFTEGDVYPLAPPEDAMQKSYVILKDKAYKDLRPGQWHAYTEHERQSIIDICNHALSRLGFSETHPLRLRIVEQTSPARPIKKSASLGGGLLISSTKKLAVPQSSPAPKSPSFSAGRASTESPKFNSEARKRFAEKGRKTIGSPLRQDDATSARGASVISSSSSDEERHARKTGQRDKRHSNTSTHSTSSGNSNTNSYTSPSSVNEEPHSESDHDTRPKVVATSLPNRPSSSFTNHEKKQQYYAQLADKFRSRYSEYEELHRQLSKDSRKNSHSDKKKSLMKLFELHNTLSEWKKRLWDYHNENSMAEEVMHLSKHRKSNSLSKISASAPSTSKLSSTERFSNGTGHMGTRQTDTKRKQPYYERQPAPRAKFALDY
ncbi:hypothetical protein OXX69_011708 [Metschnikowia pulcherrima]